MRRLLLIAMLLILCTESAGVTTGGAVAANATDLIPGTPRPGSVPARGAPHTLILVAGRLRMTDPLQANIHYITNTAYGLFRGYGYSDEDIAYLATDSALPGVDAPLSKARLRTLITEWAAARAGLNAYLTLLFVNHGDQGVIFLDHPNGEQLSPDDLARWLDLLQVQRPDIRVSVLIEASSAGGFIASPSPLSQPGRVIITSTSATHHAWASTPGAIFSDAFLGALGPETDLQAAFAAAQGVVARAGRPQYPWLDADGNAIPNEVADHMLASRVTLFDITQTPGEPADEYEPDNDCASAPFIPANGLVQEHTFQAVGDVDWVAFRPVTDTVYLVDVQVPPGSLADVVVESYRSCNGPVDWVEDVSFTPGAHLEFRASDDHPVYLKLHPAGPGMFGPRVSYELAVRGVSVRTDPGALIVVAADLGSAHPQQANVHRIGQKVYELFRGRNYADESITYLTSDPSAPGRDGLPTVQLLKEAVLTWAPTLVDADHPLTLYLVGNCEPDLFHLDRSAGEATGPQDMDAWLHQLEMIRPGLQSTIVLEGCYAGSFIGLPHTLSARGRVVIGATGSAAPAWALADGAFFSDYFLAALDHEHSLWQAFRAAQWAAEIAHSSQTPWLDGDGDGVPNESEDGTAAAQRGLPLIMAFCDRGGRGAGRDGEPTFAALSTEGGAPQCAPSWPPTIMQVTLLPAAPWQPLRIQAEVRDDSMVDRVWGVIYSPSYRTPVGCVGLTRDDVPTLILAPRGGDLYGASWSGLREPGTYRLVLYAEDNVGLRSQPQMVELILGTQIYLPLIGK